MGYRKKPLYDWRDEYRRKHPPKPEHPLGYLVALIPLDGEEVLVFRNGGQAMYLSTRDREWLYIEDSDRSEIESSGMFLHSLCARNEKDAAALIAFWQTWIAKVAEPLVYIGVGRDPWRDYSYKVLASDTRMTLSRAHAAWFGVPDARAAKKLLIERIAWTEIQDRHRGYYHEDGSKLIEAVEESFAIFRLRANGRVIGFC